MNSAYERVKPVKIDRCAAGPSESAQELASGPRKDSDLVETVKNKWSSYLPSFAKGSIATSETVATASVGTASSDKKVLQLICVCLIMCVHNNTITFGHRC